MKRCYALENGGVVEVAPERASVLVFLAPDTKDQQELTHLLGLSRSDIEAALDPDEISRVDLSSEWISTIWKRPKNATVDEHLRFDGDQTSDAGARQQAQLVDEQRLLPADVRLGESLIYYIDAIGANGGVLPKLHANADKLGLAPAQMQALSDLILDNQQCARQAQVYSGVLSGLMDARGTMINNNVSLLLKNLTLITVIFLPLNLIASIGGMSEFTMMTHGIDWRIAFSLFTLGMLVFGWASYFALVRFFERRETTRRRT